MTSASLAVLAVVLAGNSAIPASLKGCEIYGPGFGLERRIRCPAPFTVDVFMTMPAAKDKAVMGDFARMMTSSGDPKELVVTADVKVGGKSRPGLRYTRRKAGGQIDIYLLTTVPAGKGLSRMVRCSHMNAMGCLDAFTLVAKGLPDVTVPANASQPTFAGRALEVRPGCTFKAGGQLSCGSAELVWLALYPHSPDTLEAAEPFLRTTLALQGELVTRDRYCKVEGRDVLCREITVTAKGGAKTRVLYGFTALRDVSLYVSCTTQADVATELPEPCAQVMAFKPEGQQEQ